MYSVIQRDTLCSHSFLVCLATNHLIRSLFGLHVALVRVCGYVCLSVSVMLKYTPWLGFYGLVQHSHSLTVWLIKESGGVGLSKGLQNAHSEANAFTNRAINNSS